MYIFNYNFILNVASDVLEGYNEPVEVSLMTDSLAYAVSGTLRAGDRVDIVAYTNLQDKETELVLENVYISGTFDTAGNAVTADSEAVSSVVFNLIIEKEDYIDFINGTAYGGVQLVKVSDVREVK